MIMISAFAFCFEERLRLHSCSQERSGDTAQEILLLSCRLEGPSSNPYGNMLCPQHMHYKFLVCGGISPSNLLLGLTWVVLLLLSLVPLVPLASLWHLAILVGPLLLQVRYQNQAPLLSPWAASGWELAL